MLAITFQVDEETSYSRETGSASEVHKLPQVLVAGVRWKHGAFIQWVYLNIVTVSASDRY